jgi:hypothetical protein
MHYVVMSSTGNLIDSYAAEAEARAALQRIVAAEPEASDDVAMIIYGDDGLPVGVPVFAETSVGVN